MVKPSLVLAVIVAFTAAVVSGGVQAQQSPLVEISKNTTGERAARVQASITIDAPVEIIWMIMLDCNEALEIVPHLSECVILRRDDETASDIRRHKVRYGALFPTTISEFKSVYDRNKSIRFSKTGGDLKFLEGVWRFVPDINGVQVTYEAAVNIGKPVPGFLVRRAVRNDTREILTRLQARAETKASGASPPDVE